MALEGSDGGLARYRLVTQPCLAFLGHRRDSLVFQGMTVVQIVDEVFGRTALELQGPDCDCAPGVAPVWLPAGETRVFAYLRGAHPEHADVLRALDTLGGATECFIPDAPAQGADLPASACIHYSTDPIDLSAAMAACALVICHAGHATVAQALRAGVPCLLLPLQAEQFLLARQVERTGAAVNAASLARPLDCGVMIDRMTRPHGPHASAAHALANRYRDSSTPPR